MDSVEVLYAGPENGSEKKSVTNLEDTDRDQMSNKTKTAEICSDKFYFKKKVQPTGGAAALEHAAEPMKMGFLRRAGQPEVVHSKV